MNSTVSDRLNGMPLQNAKASLRSSESAHHQGETVRQNPTRSNLTPRGALVDQARKNAGIEVKQMAAWMGVSESFLLRGFKDQEHLSYQRLQLVSAQSVKFHREFLIGQAQEIEGVDVITEIRVRRSEVA